MPLLPGAHPRKIRIASNGAVLVGLVIFLLCVCLVLVEKKRKGGRWATGKKAKINKKKKKGKKKTMVHLVCLFD